MRANRLQANASKTEDELDDQPTDDINCPLVPERGFVTSRDTF